MAEEYSCDHAWFYATKFMSFPYSRAVSRTVAFKKNFKTYVVPLLRYFIRRKNLKTLYILSDATSND